MISRAIDRFSNMDGKQKLMVLAIALVVIIGLLAVMTGRSQPDTPAPVETTQQAPKPTASPSSPQPSTSPSPSPSPTTSERAMPPVEEMVGTLGGEEEHIAMAATEAAVLEFLRWPEGESVDARMKRLTASVASNSPVRALAPDLEDADGYDLDGVGGITSLGSVDYLYAVGGNKDRWRVAVGTSLRWQLTTAGDSHVNERKTNLVVDMTKENGEWKILAISDE